MARTKTKATEPAKKVSNLPEPEQYKYDLKALQDATGLEPASLRSALRKSDFVKAGRNWGWDLKSEFEKVVAHFKGRDSKGSKAAAKPVEKEAPTRRRKAA